MPRKNMPRKKTTATATVVPSGTVAQVHETTESAALIELTPPHPPRVDTPEYEQTHKLLVFEKDTPCKVCGVRHSILADASKAADATLNPAGAKALETHHYPCERSLIDALDWRRVHNDFPAVYSEASLQMWVDSPQNMLVLCDVHHRDPEQGIHHLLTQDFAAMPYLKAGYRVAASAKDAAALLARDEAIERGDGTEAAVAQEMAAAPAKPKRTRKPRARKTVPASPSPVA